MRKNLFGEENLAVAESLVNLALIRRDEHNLPEAEGLFQEAAAMVCTSELGPQQQSHNAGLFAQGRGGNAFLERI